MEEFRTVERKVVTVQDDIRAAAQREHREQRSGQPEFDFASDSRSNAFEVERSQQLLTAKSTIVKLLGNGPMQYEILQPLILQLRLVWKSDLNKILTDMRKAEELWIDGLGPKERAPKSGCALRLRSS